MSGSNDVSDVRLIGALLDPVNVKIFEFLKTSGPFKVGKIQSELKDVPYTKSGFSSRLKKLEAMGFVVRFELRRNKKMRQKNQHTTWQPFDRSFYERLLQQREALILIAKETKNIATIALAIPDVVDTAAELNSTHNRPAREKDLRKKMRLKLSPLMDRFGDLGDTMKKRSLEWAIQAKYFEEMKYT